jgi:hypothetical protein
VWPKGKATVFGTVDCRFESYHPKGNWAQQDEKATNKRESNSGEEGLCGAAALRGGS